MLGNNCRGSGTDTRKTGTDTPKQKYTSSHLVPVQVPGKPVQVPQSRNSPVAKWYRYHTYWYWYQHVIFMGFEQNSNFGARECSSFDHQFEITKEKGIKTKGKGRGAAFDPRVLVS